MDSYAKLFVSEVRLLLFASKNLSILFNAFFIQVLHPFYLFQVFSIAVWLWDDYYGTHLKQRSFNQTNHVCVAYAICIFIMATVSSIISVYQARKNRQKLREMVRTITDVTIIRDGQPSKSIFRALYIEYLSLLNLLTRANAPCSTAEIQ